MDIRHFQTFKTIVEEGSFIGAARALNYAQSSITSHVQVMEEYYEQPLFDRMGKKVVLNAFGVQVYEQIVPLLASYEGFMELLEEASMIWE